MRGRVFRSANLPAKLHFLGGVGGSISTFHRNSLRAKAPLCLSCSSAKLAFPSAKRHFQPGGKPVVASAAAACETGRVKPNPYADALRFTVRLLSATGLAFANYRPGASALEIVLRLVAVAVAAVALRWAWQSPAK